MDLGCLIPVGSSHPPLVKVQCALYQLVMDLGCLIPVGSSHPPLVKVQCALYQLVMDLGCLIPVGSSHPLLVKVQCALYQLVMDLGCLIPVGSSHPPLVKVQCALYQLVMDLIVQGCLISETMFCFTRPTLVGIPSSQYFYQLVNNLIMACVSRYLDGETTFSSSHPICLDYCRYPSPAVKGLSYLAPVGIPSLQDNIYDLPSEVGSSCLALVKNPSVQNHYQPVKNPDSRYFIPADTFSSSHPALANISSHDNYGPPAGKKALVKNPNHHFYNFPSPDSTLVSSNQTVQDTWLGGAIVKPCAETRNSSEGSAAVFSTYTLEVSPLTSPHVSLSRGGVFSRLSNPENGNCGSESGGASHNSGGDGGGDRDNRQGGSRGDEDGSHGDSGRGDGGGDRGGGDGKGNSKSENTKKKKQKKSKKRDRGKSSRVRFPLAIPQAGHKVDRSRGSGKGSADNPSAAQSGGEEECPDYPSSFLTDGSKQPFRRSARAAAKQNSDRVTANLEETTRQKELDVARERKSSFGSSTDETGTIPISDAMEYYFTTPQECTGKGIAALCINNKIQITSDPSSILSIGGAQPGSPPSGPHNCSLQTLDNGAVSTMAPYVRVFPGNVEQQQLMCSVSFIVC